MLVLGLVDPSAGGGPRGPDPRFLVWGPLVLAVLEASTFVGSRSTCVTVGLCRGLLGGGLLGATLLLGLGLGCRLLVLLGLVLLCFLFRLIFVQKLSFRVRYLTSGKYTTGENETRDTHNQLFVK